MKEPRSCAISLGMPISMLDRSHLERVAIERRLSLTILHDQIGDHRDEIEREVFHPTPVMGEMHTLSVLPLSTPEGTLHGITSTEHGMWFAYAERGLHEQAPHFNDLDDLLAHLKSV